MFRSSSPRPSVAARLVPACAGLLVLMWMAGPAAAYIEGYAYPPSVAQGETVSLFVSTDQSEFDLHFVREGGFRTTYLVVQDLPGSLQVVPDSAWANGCDWSPSFSLEIPQSWASGVYVTYLVTGTSTMRAVFVVREDNPGATSDILFQTSINTWQAYNSWGGHSLYGHNSENGEASHAVSFERPYVAGNGQGQLHVYELPMIRWLENEGYVLEYCTNQDTHFLPGLEDNYTLFMSVGHDEYWSREMRDNIEDRIKSGRNVGFFGGNTSWWGIRYSPSGDQMICYKDAATDPIVGVDNSRATVHWFEYPLNRPENLMTGVSFRNGGYVNHGTTLPAEEGYGDYTVCRADHWVFEGTGLSDGDEFGWEDTIVGYEADGALFEWVNGVPVVSGNDGTPMTFTILGISPATRGGREGFATMGVYQWVGTVFNAATTDWSHGLENDVVVQTITRNVVDELLVRSTTVSAETPPPSRITSARSFPNPFHTSTRIAFQTSTPASVALEVFDVQGRRLQSLAQRDLAAGTHTLSWHGRDAFGRPVGPGIYFFRLQVGEEVRVGRMVKRP